jgi:Mrp family chromosome partitioning ATPase
MANSGSKVVLVDGDLRRPGVTKLMSTATPHGVVELLQGRLTLEEVIVQDSATSACMIPAGVLGSERRDLFSTPAMDDLIAELSARFDYVLIDTPATLAVADARTIAAKADTVLFLVRWSKTPARAALTALNMLQETGANFAGVVLSRVDLRRQMLFSYGDRDYYFKDYRSYYTSAS